MNTDGKLLTEAFATFMEEWSALLNVGLGFATLLGLLAFGYALTLLNVKSDNPQGRQDAIARLWKVGITTALTGGFWTVVWSVYILFLK